MSQGVLKRFTPKLGYTCTCIVIVHIARQRAPRTAAADARTRYSCKYLEQKSRLGPRGPGTSACGESRAPGRTAQKSGTRAPPVGRPDSRGRAAPRWFRASKCRKTRQHRGHARPHSATRAAAATATATAYYPVRRLLAERRLVAATRLLAVVVAEGRRSSPKLLSRQKMTTS